MDLVRSLDDLDDGRTERAPDDEGDRKAGLLGQRDGGRLGKPDRIDSCV